MRVNAINNGLKEEIYWVRPLRDADRAGVWRLAGVISLALGGAAVWQSRRDPDLSPRQQAISGVVSGVYATGGGFVILYPDKLARAVMRRPRRTLVGAFTPLVSAMLTGGVRTPLDTLAAAAAGGSAVIYGQRTGTRAARYVHAAWMPQALAFTKGDPHRPSGARSHVAVPLTYLVNARVTAALIAFAYQAHSVDSTLMDLAARRKDLLTKAHTLDAQLAAATPLLVEVLRRPGVTPRQRDLALCALDRLHEARAALGVTLAHHQPAPPHRVYRFVRQFFVRQGIATDEEDVPLRTRRLADVARDQRAALSALVPESCTMSLKIPEDIEISGVDRLAVAAAATTAGIANAVRHAEGLSRIVVSAERDDDVIRLLVDNDGSCSDPPELGLGVRALDREAARLGGSVTVCPQEDGWFRMTLTLPGLPPDAESGQLHDWRQIEAKLDAVLLEAAGTSALITVANLMAKPSSSLKRTVASACLTLLAPLGYALHVLHGRPQHTSPKWPLVLSAAVSAVHTDPHRGILSGWSNAALSRDSLHNAPWRTGLLTAANVLGVVVAYVRTSERVLAATQIATLMSGPTAILVFVLPAVGRLRERERDVIGTMSAIETVNRIALQIHGNHSCVEPVDHLLADEGLDEDLRASLRETRNGISASSGDEVNPYTAILEALVGQFCTVMGRRVFPAAIAVRPSGSLGRAGGREDASDLNRMRIWRELIGVADVLAREILGRRPVRLSGTRNVTRVEVRVGAMKRSSTLLFTVSPVEREGDQHEATVREAIAALGGAVREWSGDQLTVAVYPARERDVSL